MIRSVRLSRANRVGAEESQLHHLVEISVTVNKFDLDAGEI
jgi:hypothetical protein